MEAFTVSPSNESEEIKQSNEVCLHECKGFSMYTMNVGDCRVRIVRDYDMHAPLYRENEKIDYSGKSYLYSREIEKNKKLEAFTIMLESERFGTSSNYRFLLPTKGIKNETLRKRLDKEMKANKVISEFLTTGANVLETEEAWIKELKSTREGLVRKSLEEMPAKKLRSEWINAQGIAYDLKNKKKQPKTQSRLLLSNTVLALCESVQKVKRSQYADLFRRIEEKEKERDKEAEKMNPIVKSFSTNFGELKGIDKEIAMLWSAVHVLHKDSKWIKSECADITWDIEKRHGYPRFPEVDAQVNLTIKQAESTRKIMEKRWVELGGNNIEYEVTPQQFKSKNQER